MKIFLLFMLQICSLVLLLEGCGGSGGGTSGGNTSTGKDSVAVAVQNTVPTNVCPNGGIAVQTGIDTNGNGILDPSEVQNTQYVCNGANGLTALVSMTTETAGVNCSYGGQRISAGLDTNGNGILDSSEITASSYICNGANGTNGANGSNGFNTLMSVVSEPSGSNCTNGGIKVNTGLDTNRNGVLDSNEVSSTYYVCNGSGGGDTQAPTTPLNLIATVISESQINLSWTASTDSVGVVAYDVWRGPLKIATTTATSYSDTGLSTATTYTYTVDAYDAAGNISAKSAPASAKTPPFGVVRGITATSGDTQVVLRWSAVGGATSYTIYWSTISGVNKGSGSIIPNISETNFIHNGLVNGTTYYYVITASNANGESLESAQVSTTPASGLPFTLATGLNSPYWITVDNTQAYWTESGSVKKVSLSGGTVTTLASGLSSPIGIVVDASNVYWAETMGNVVRKVSINGGSVITLATFTTYPGFIAQDANYIYVATQGSPGVIGKIDKNSGGMIALVSDFQYKVGIAVDASNVYWTEWSANASIKKIDKNGGAITVLVTALDHPWDIAVDGTNVYWSEEGTDKSIKKVSVNGGSVTTLASNLGDPFGVVVDSNYVYWTDLGTVNKVSINGGTATAIASGLNGPMGIAIDTNYVYWVEQYGSIIKILK